MSEQFTISTTNPESGDVISATIEPGQPIRIGRSMENDLSIVWNREISRVHAAAEAHGNELKVACLDSGRNPLILGALTSREIFLRGGDEFQIGQTVFHVHSNIEESSLDNSSEIEEFSLAGADLAQYEFGDSAKQLHLLCDLPDYMSQAENNSDLAQMMTGLLLEAIPEAIAVAAVLYDEETVELLRVQEPDDNQILMPATMRVRTRANYEGRFLPSRQLVGRAFRLEASTIHIWGVREESGRFTMTDNLNWAFCVPVPGKGNEGWCLYVAGQGGKSGAVAVTKETLESDVRFTQLLAKFIGSARSIRLLQETQTQLASFFSPKVMENLVTAKTAEILVPSERDITVLFCDVRGFSRKSEQHQDNLLYLLDCVKEALGAMTQGILEFDGAIADFQGDAALGFWGWPVALEDGAIPACRAALAIHREFNSPRESTDLLEGFSIGLGIAHGRAVAGQIGTRQQAKVGVFGPVVNQGARLEGLTRHFDVPICIDEKSAEFARARFSPDQARVRPLARIRPKGMDTPINISELLAPAGGDSVISDEHVAAYESALSQVITGAWSDAIVTLSQMTDDGAADFLLRHMSQHNNEPPADWDGAFTMTSK